ncbi:MAG: hypothetical protein PHP54_02140 [Clostridia bacterium]|nr:hypothetical protein [Clostridia bacterium]
MKLDLIFQMDDQNTLSEAISDAFSKEPKKAYFFYGCLKDTGFRLLEEEFIDRKTKIFFALGVDKKNTTRSILEDLLRYTKDVYYYSNNNEVEFDSNICVFEYTKEAIMLVCANNMSESGLKEHMALYTKVTFDLENVQEAKEYKEKIKEITKKIEKEKFEKLTKEKIEELVEKKEIFSTKQYVHTIKSISELLGKKEPNKIEVSNRTSEEIYGSDTPIPKIDLSDSDIDIEIEVQEDETKPVVSKKEIKKKNDIELDLSGTKELQDLSKLSELIGYHPDDDEIDKNNELYDKSLEDMNFDDNDTLDINNLLFSKADIKLNVEEPKKVKETESKENKIQEDNVIKTKKLDLNNITNYIYELPTRNSKGQDLVSLKIPNYIQLMMPNFFELSENGKNVQKDGSNYKIRDVKLEIVDVKNAQKYMDREAKIVHKAGQSYMTITSDTLKNIEYNENDIARIIKLSSDIFHIEIISKDLQEYKLWSKVCTQKFKSSTRSYGVM